MCDSHARHGGRMADPSLLGINMVLGTKPLTTTLRKGPFVKVTFGGVNSHTQEGWSVCKTGFLPGTRYPHQPTSDHFFLLDTSAS
jgi:hypothetical protein